MKISLHINHFHQYWLSLVWTSIKLRRVLRASLFNDDIKYPGNISLTQHIMAFIKHIYLKLFQGLMKAKIREFMEAMLQRHHVRALL